MSVRAMDGNPQTFEELFREIFGDDFHKVCRGDWIVHDMNLPAVSYDPPVVSGFT